MTKLGKYWSGRFDDWGARPPQESGYTLLVPVPGDLPVFLELALSVLGQQDSRRRIETLVIPDTPSPQVDRIIERHREGWDGPLRCVSLPLPERHLLPLLGNPSRNHGVQLITGVRAAHGEFVVLHDADLFLLRPGVLDAQVDAAQRERLDVLGVDPVWDSWYLEQGISLAATWEMCARTDWMRSFPPSMHMGHDGELRGLRHTFDTTLHPQSVSDPSRIRIQPSQDIVHFNYVISTYRHFQRSKEGPFVDDHFRILLIRLFVDLFGEEAAEYGLPTLAELADGLRSSSTAVVYPRADAHARDIYHDYRAKVERILQGDWTTGCQRRDLVAHLQVFDDFYALEQEYR